MHRPQVMSGMQQQQQQRTEMAIVTVFDLYVSSFLSLFAGGPCCCRRPPSCPEPEPDAQHHGCSRTALARAEYPLVCIHHRPRRRLACRVIARMGQRQCLRRSGIASRANSGGGGGGGSSSSSSSSSSSGGILRQDRLTVRDGTQRPVFPAPVRARSDPAAARSPHRLRPGAACCQLRLLSPP